ncbi:MAG: nitroreductase family protein [Prevotella sp.]|jgi:nitroreductase|nr:nitroreductase family protein [Prevotella sp.]
MQLKKLIESRYSVRAYLSQPVETEKIGYILECARLAPSACNLQPWKFYIVTSDEAKQRVQESYNREWFKAAPVYIVVCADSSASWKRKNTDEKDFGDIDAAIAAEHICLAAAEVGLGACWVCNFIPNVLVKALNIPSPLEPLVIFSLGYTDTEKSVRSEKTRKPLSETTEWM